MTKVPEEFLELLPGNKVRSHAWPKFFLFSFPKNQKPPKAHAGSEFITVHTICEKGSSNDLEELDSRSEVDNASKN